MSNASPLIEITDLEKSHPAPRPLRLRRLVVGQSDRFALAGFDEGAAETLVHLITGAALPDRGEIRIDGRSTRDIATDTEWLASLDRFGIVTARAILLETMAIAANLALPLTVAIDPLSKEVEARVKALADEVGIARSRLAEPAASLRQAERAAVHLARALAIDPAVLLLEHPTAGLPAADAEAFGSTLRRVSETRRLAWVALTNDDRFARRAGGTRLRLNADTGELAPDGFWRSLKRGLRLRA